MEGRKHEERAAPTKESKHRKGCTMEDMKKGGDQDSCSNIFVVFACIA